MPRPVECVYNSQFFNAIDYYEMRGHDYNMLLLKKVRETENAFLAEIDKHNDELKALEKKIHIIMDNDRLTEKKVQRLLEPLITKAVSIEDEIKQLMIDLDDAVEFDYISKAEEFARISDNYGALSLKTYGKQDPSDFGAYTYGSGKMRTLLKNVLVALSRTNPKFKRQKIDRENGVTENWRKINRTNTNGIINSMRIFFPQVLLGVEQKDALTKAINNPRPRISNQFLSRYENAIKQQSELNEIFKFDFDLFGGFIIEFLSQVANGAKFETCHTELNNLANKILPGAAQYYLEKASFDIEAFAFENYEPETVYKSIGNPTRRQKRFYEQKLQNAPIECKPSELQIRLLELFKLPVKTTEQEPAAA